MSSVNTKLEENVEGMEVPVGGPVPVGSVAMFAGAFNATSINRLFTQGWLPCNGEEQATRDFPDLFSVIGYSHGGGGDRFRVPDLRGRFVRGVDLGARRDPDAGARTPAAGGGNGGDQVGSVQNDELRRHAHKIPNLPHDQHWLTDMAEKYYAARHSADSRYSDSEGGSETRPVNLGLNFIIRYRKDIKDA